jgi:hypothetical protein
MKSSTQIKYNEIVLTSFETIRLLRCIFDDDDPYQQPVQKQLSETTSYSSRDEV